MFSKLLSLALLLTLVASNSHSGGRKRGTSESGGQYRRHGSESGNGGNYHRPRNGERCKSDNAFEIEQLLLSMQFKLDDLKLGIIKLEDFTDFITEAVSDDFTFTNNNITLNKDNFIKTISSTVDLVLNYHFNINGGILFELLDYNFAKVRINNLEISNKLDIISISSTKCQQLLNLQIIYWEFEKINDEWKVLSVNSSVNHNIKPTNGDVACVKQFVNTFYG